MGTQQKILAPNTSGIIYMVAQPWFLSPNEADLGSNNLILGFAKVGCVFSRAVWSEFRMLQYRDDDYQEHALHFKNVILDHLAMWALVFLLR